MVLPNEPSEPTPGPTGDVPTLNSLYGLPQGMLLPYLSAVGAPLPAGPGVGFGLRRSKKNGMVSPACGSDFSRKYRRPSLVAR